MLKMFPLSSDDKCALLNIARQAISGAVSEQRLPDCPQNPSIPGGTFVTLHRSGRLRGCVGQIGAAGSLEDTVARAAIGAALYDPRFPPVSQPEIAGLEIEISVLSPPQPMALEAIVLGRHGVIVVRNEQRGLLLPQVAAGRKWSAERLLEEACGKAGLSRDAWRDPSTQVLGFTAEVFSERIYQEVSGI